MNTRPTSRVSMVVALLICFCVAYAANRATAGARLAPPSAPIIAVIDLEEALSKLGERSDKEKTLKDQVAELQARINKYGEDLKSDQSKFELEIGPAKAAMGKQIREKMIRAEFEKQYSQKLLTESQGEMLRDLYVKISDAAKRVAEKNGYQIVLASDEKVNIPKGDPDGVTRAIALKRFLYVDPQLNITGEVVEMMNNEYAAGKK